MCRGAHGIPPIVTMKETVRLIRPYANRLTAAAACLWLCVPSAMARRLVGDSIRTLPEAEVSARQGLDKAGSPDLWQRADSRVIEAAGMTGVADVVKSFAGVAVRDYGGIGGMKTVSIRGAGACHTAVSYGGIVVSNTQAGQIDIGRFATENMASVGMSMGQGSGHLLSARHLASAAVVELSPRTALTADGKTHPYARITAGSYGLWDFGAGVSAQLASRLGIAASASYTLADGNYPYTLHNGSRTTRERRDGSDVEALKGELNLAWLSRHGRLDAFLNYYRSERGLPGGVILYAEEAHERLWDEHWSAQGVFTTPLHPDVDLAIRAKYSHSWNKYVDTDVKYSGGKRTDIYHQSEWYAAASAEWRPLGWMRITLAADLAAATLKSNVSTQPDPLRLSAQSALRIEMDYGRLHADAYAVATAMGDCARSSKEAEVSTASLSSLVPQPSIGLSYRLFQHENVFLRARLKHTFRVPTFTDMYYLHIGNTGLKPEKACLLSGGAAWSGNIGHQIHMAMACDIYINNVSDKIVCFPTTYVWRMRNVGKARIFGIDAVAELAARAWRGVELRLRGAYTYQDARDRSDTGQALYNAVLPYSPRHQGSAMLSASWHGLTVAYQLTACGARYSSQQNIEEYRVSPYGEHNLTLSADFHAKSTRLKASLSVMNLTDSQYEVVKYYPMPGRSLRMSVKAEF